MDEILDSLTEIIESDDPASRKSKRLVAWYGNATNELRPFLDAFPLLAEELAQDLILVAQAGLKIISTIENDEGIRTARAAREMQTARDRKKTLHVYMDSGGFTRAEAFALLMQDIKNAQADSAVLKGIPSKAAATMKK